MTLEEILCGEDVIKKINENEEELFDLIPELKMIVGFEHKHPHHHLDVWKHTLLAIGLSKDDFDIRLTLLLHDIGKPLSCIEGEIRHYPNHALISSEISYNILKRLNYDEIYIEKICYLIRYHDTPINDEDIKEKKNLTIKRLQIQKCDAFAHNPKYLDKRKEYLEKIKSKLLK